MGRLKEQELSRYPYGAGYQNTDTSRAAAAGVTTKTTTWRQRVIEVLHKAGPNGATVHETAAALGAPVSTIQPRFSELVQLGRIRDSEKRRVNPSSGKKAIVYILDW